MISINEPTPRHHRIARRIIKLADLPEEATDGVLKKVFKAGNQKPSYDVVVAGMTDTQFRGLLRQARKEVR